MKEKRQKSSRWTGEKIPKRKREEKPLRKKKKNTLKRTEKFFKNLGEHLNTVKSISIVTMMIQTTKD